MLPQRKFINTIEKCNPFEAILFGIIAGTLTRSFFVHEMVVMYNPFRYYAMGFTIYFTMLYIVGKDKEEHNGKSI